LPTFARPGCARSLQTGPPARSSLSALTRQTRAFREQHSRPVTPATATSWGAPEYWPPTPVERSRPHTPDYAQRAHNEDYPASFNHARPWAYVWPFSEMYKEQQRVLLESEHGGFRFVWPFMVMELETTHDGDHPASFNHANPWAHVWPFSKIRQEQRRALLEGNHGGFRFVWPFMSQGPQPAIESTSGVHGTWEGARWQWNWKRPTTKTTQARSTTQSPGHMSGRSPRSIRNSSTLCWKANMGASDSFGHP